MIIALCYLQEAHPVRLKAIHVINCTTFLDRVMYLVKPFMKKQVANMVSICLIRLPEHPRRIGTYQFSLCSYTSTCPTRKRFMIIFQRTPSQMNTEESKQLLNTKPNGSSDLNRWGKVYYTLHLLVERVDHHDHQYWLLSIFRDYFTDNSRWDIDESRKMNNNNNNNINEMCGSLKKLEIDWLVKSIFVQAGEFSIKDTNLHSCILIQKRWYKKSI